MIRCLVVLFLTLLAWIKRALRGLVQSEVQNLWILSTTSSTLHPPLGATVASVAIYAAVKYSDL
jgi:hypothetical protein